MMKGFIEITALAIVALLIIGGAVGYGLYQLKTNGETLGTSTFVVQQGGSGVNTFSTGELLYGSGTNPIRTTATTTVSCAGTASCTTFTAIGGSPVTITGAAAAAGSSAFEVATTSDIAQSQVAYISKASGRTTLASVATSTFSITGPFNGVSALGALVGGSNSAVTYWGLATTSPISGSQVLYANGNSGVASVATTTFTVSGPFNVPSTLGYLAGGSNATIAYWGLSTSTALTNGRLLYSNGLNGVYDVATTTLSVSGPFTLPSPGTLVGGSNTTLTWTGLATTTQPSSSNLLVSNGGAGVFGVATTSVSCSGSTSCTAFTAIGGAPITISSTGGGSGVGTVSTSTTPTLGQLPYWTSSGAWPETLGTVATTTFTISGPFNVPSTRGALVGGSTATIGYWGLATSSNITSSHLLFGNGGGGGLVSGVATSTLTFSSFPANIPSTYGALVGGSNTTATWWGLATSTTLTSGRLLYSNGVNGVFDVATGTVSAGSTALTVTAGRAAIGGALSIDCATATGSQNGCLSSADWTTFNNKQATISVTWPITLSGATIGFGGLSTSTAAVQGNIPYFSGANTFANVATSSLTAGTGVTFSGTAGALVGGTALTINTPWTISGNDIFFNKSGYVGIGSTTPIAGLAIGSTTSVTTEPLVLATSTAMTIGMASSTYVYAKMGTSNFTITYSDFMLYPGQKQTLELCTVNGGTGGTLTLVNVHYSGGVSPANTTTAKQCDLLYFSTSMGTSTPIVTLTGMVPGVQ